MLLSNNKTKIGFATHALLFLAFFAFVLIYFFGHRSISESYELTKEIWRSRLVALASDRHDAIQRWMQEQRYYLNVLSQQIENSRGAFLDNPHHQVNCHSYHDYSSDIVGIYFIDVATGSIFKSMDKSIPLLNSDCLSKLLSDKIPDAYFCKVNKTPLVLFKKKILSKNSKKESLVVLAVDPQKWLYPLLLREPVATESGESFLVSREGDFILVLSPLRHHTSPPLSLKLFPDQNIPSTYPEKGITLFSDTWRDYQNMSVLTATKSIEKSNWGLVVKVNKEEAFKLYRINFFFTSIAVLALITSTIVILSLIWKNQRRRYLEDVVRIEAPYRLLMQQAYDAIFFLDQEGSILDANASASSEYQYSKAELIGKKIHGLIKLKEEIHELATGIVSERQQIRRDGTSFPGLVSAKGILIENRLTVVIIVHNIAKLKDAEENLRIGSEKLQEIFNIVPVGIAIFDENEKLVEANPAIKQIEREAFSLDLISFAKSIPANVNQEVELKMVDGRSSWFLLNLSLLPFSDWNALISITDITAQKLVQEELKLYQDVLEKKSKELQRSNDELEQFSSVASHDLQGPLRTIRCYLELLTSNRTSPEESQQFINCAIGCADQMFNTINALLTYAHVGASTELKTVNVVNVIKEVLNNLKSQITSKNVLINFDSLIPAPLIRCDFHQLVQLFQNLIDNSIKYNDSERPIIHIKCFRRQKSYIFSVEDNGIGIKSKFSDKIFDPFQRLHREDKYPGSGIGLAICRKIINSHGGKIWVSESKSALGGAIFYFTIPLDQSNAA
ncbi:MAG: PAS domain S-box protein [Oligoflexia bacterium]|nr:PAS domain S-box protein [Oligoflexia bacterium]